MVDRFDRLGHLVLGKKLLHHQKFGEMLVPTILRMLCVLSVLEIDEPTVMRTVFVWRDQPAFRASRRDRVPGGLQARFDIAEHREDLGRIGFLE